ncbi:MAG: sulfite exporter TauE/SafE family protein [Acidobacteriota bacterium]|nr:sulfite exporter TauE/SafE family protein [Acidobacteriota bacterium]
MIEFSAVVIVAAIFLVAILYSSVGHGGASGYLAVLALLAVEPNITRPTALILNLFVASIAFVQFYRAGHFDWKIFLPFAAGSVPFAFLGGMIHLPIAIYKIILGAVLMLAAIRLAINLKSGLEPRAPRVWICLIIGAILGFVSGLVGVGGGIFLTPILLLMNWTETKKAAGVSALFILVNSISGLLGNWLLGKDSQISNLPQNVWLWILAAVIGGIIGSTFGSFRFNSLTLRRVLAAGLLIAGAKLIFT